MPAKPPESQLPEIVEGVLSLFEGFKGESVTFCCLERNNSATCVFCGELTVNRLQVSKNGEPLSLMVACRTCLKGAGNSASQNSESEE